MAKFDASQFNSQMRQAVRRAQQDLDRQLRATQQQAERQVKQQMAAFNRNVAAEARRVDAHNRKVVNDHNRAIEQHNRRADQHNKKVVAEINRRLAAAARPQVTVEYTPAEQELVDRVQAALPADVREYDTFLSYVRIDGAEVTGELYEALTSLGVTAFLDTAEMIPGKSVARQLDRALGRARTGIVVITPAYLTGRFWSEMELGALLHKDTVIPVLHNVTFADVAKYSTLLGDKHGFTTAEDSVQEIAAKIASALIDPETIDPAA